MKKIKRVIFLLIILFVSFLLFKNSIYNICFSYKEIGNRTNYNVENKELQTVIDSAISNTELKEIDQIINLSLEITKRHLIFQIDSKINNPNELFPNGKANCIGYAAHTAAVSNYMIAKSDLQKWKAQPVKGWMYLFKQNMHEMTDKPYFEDHDIVVFKNPESKEEIYVDPSVYEYIGIKQLKKYQK